jgi:hypothetical protein
MRILQMTYLEKHWHGGPSVSPARRHGLRGAGARRDRALLSLRCARAARAQPALAGELVYPLKAPRADGTTHVVFSPRSFLTRLSWLLVQPRSHLTRYHGVLAPNHAWRSLIVLKPPVKPALKLPRRSGHDWASLLRRVFAIEVLVCSFCGGERRVIADIKEGPVARQILAHLGLPTRAPKPAQGSLFPTGPPAVDEPEASVAWSDADYDQRLPDSEQFA